MQIDPVSDTHDFLFELKRQINEILNRDLYNIDRDSRSIEKWLFVYGDDINFKETKELLVCLEVLMVDTEILNLHTKQELAG